MATANLYRISLVLGYLSKGEVRSNVEVISTNVPEETLEAEAGQFEIGNVDVVARGIPADYFAEAFDPEKPFIYELLDDGGNLIFWGIVEDAKYNRRTKRTTFSALSPEYLLKKSKKLPARSVYEVDAYRWVFRDGKLIYSVHEKSEVNAGDVLVVELESGDEYRAPITHVSEPVQQGAVKVKSVEVTAPVSTASALSLKPSDVAFSLSGTDTFYTYFRGDKYDAVAALFPREKEEYHNVELRPNMWRVQVLNPDGTVWNEDALLRVRHVRDFVNGGWYAEVGLRAHGKKIPTADLTEITVNFLKLFSEPSGDGTKKLRILGRAMYGYKPADRTVTVPFIGTIPVPSDAYRIGTLISALVTVGYAPAGVIADTTASGRPLGLLPWFIRNINIDGVTSTRGEEASDAPLGSIWIGTELSDNPMEALRELQMVSKSLIRFQPVLDGGVPRVDVEITPRQKVGPSASAIPASEIIEWEENVVRRRLEAVVVRANEDYFAPKEGPNVAGFWYESSVGDPWEAPLTDPTVSTLMSKDARRYRGVPEGEKVLEIAVPVVPSYAGVWFSGEEVLNDNMLAPIARYYYDWFNSASREINGTFRGLRSDLLGKIVSVQEGEGGHYFESTLLVTKVSPDHRTNKTTFTGLILPTYITPTDIPPRVIVTGERAYQLARGETEMVVRLDASRSYDPSGGELQYEWYVHDGTNYVLTDGGAVFDDTLTQGTWLIRLKVTSQLTGLSRTEDLSLYVAAPLARLQTEAEKRAIRTEAFEKELPDGSRQGVLRVYPQAPDLLRSLWYRTATGEELKEVDWDQSPNASDWYPKGPFTQTDYKYSNEGAFLDLVVTLHPRHLSHIEAYVAFHENLAPTTVRQVFDSRHEAAFVNSSLAIDSGGLVRLTARGNADTKEVGGIKVYKAVRAAGGDPPLDPEGYDHYNDLNNPVINVPIHTLAEGEVLYVKVELVNTSDNEVGATSHLAIGNQAKSETGNVGYLTLSDFERTNFATPAVDGTVYFDSTGAEAGLNVARGGDFHTVLDQGNFSTLIGSNFVRTDVDADITARYNFLNGAGFGTHGLLIGEDGMLAVRSADGTNYGTLAVENLIIHGNLDQYNTTILEVEDQYIKVNRGVTGTPTLNGGLVVERGTQADAQMVWDEGIDRWGSRYENQTFYPFIRHNAGDDATVNNLRANGTGEISGNFTVAGVTNLRETNVGTDLLNRNLRVHGTGTLTTLDVTGNGSVAGNLGVTGDVTVQGSTSLRGTTIGDSTTASPLTVYGHTELRNTADLRGSTTVRSNLGTANFVSQLQGWRINNAGLADFRTIYADELIVKAFTADVAQALVGSSYLTKSRAQLNEPFTVPPVGSQGVLSVEDLEEMSGMAVFTAGDTVRLRVVDRTGGGLTVADVWGVVGGYTQHDGYQTWNFLVKQALTEGLVVPKGSVALDYGVSGDGLIVSTVLDPQGSPYERTILWFDDTGNGVPDRYELKTQVGNLAGINRTGIGDLQGFGGYFETLYVYRDANNFIRNDASGLEIRVGGSNISETTGNLTESIASLTTRVENNEGQINLRTTTTQVEEISGEVASTAVSEFSVTAGETYARQDSLSSYTVEGGDDWAVTVVGAEQVTDTYDVQFTLSLASAGGVTRSLAGWTSLVTANEARFEAYATKTFLDTETDRKIGDARAGILAEVGDNYVTLSGLAEQTFTTGDKTKSLAGWVATIDENTTAVSLKASAEYVDTKVTNSIGEFRTEVSQEYVSISGLAERTITTPDGADTRSLAGWTATIKENETFAKFGVSKEYVDTERGKVATNLSTLTTKVTDEYARQDSLSIYNVEGGDDWTVVIASATQVADTYDVQFDLAIASAGGVTRSLAGWTSLVTANEARFEAYATKNLLDTETDRKIGVARTGILAEVGDNYVTLEGLAERTITTPDGADTRSLAGWTATIKENETFAKFGVSKEYVDTERGKVAKNLSTLTTTVTDDYARQDSLSAYNVEGGDDWAVSVVSADQIIDTYDVQFTLSVASAGGVTRTLAGWTSLVTANEARFEAYATKNLLDTETDRKIGVARTGILAEVGDNYVTLSGLAEQTFTTGDKTKSLAGWVATIDENTTAVSLKASAEYVDTKVTNSIGEFRTEVSQEYVSISGLAEREITTITGWTVTVKGAEQVTDTFDVQFTLDVVAAGPVTRALAGWMGEVNDNRAQINAVAELAGNTAGMKATVDRLGSRAVLYADASGVVSSITAESSSTGSTVTISAESINMQGVVNIINNGGTTTIDGGRISTNTITANQIDTNHLFARSLTMTGSGTIRSGNSGITAMGTDPTSIRIWAGALTSGRGSAPFRVTNEGTVFASNASIKGHIEATSGTFSGDLNAARGSLGSLSLQGVLDVGTVQVDGTGEGIIDLTGTDHTLRLGGNAAPGAATWRSRLGTWSAGASDPMTVYRHSSDGLGAHTNYLSYTYGSTTETTDYRVRVPYELTAFANGSANAVAEVLIRVTVGTSTYSSGWISYNGTSIQGGTGSKTYEQTITNVAGGTNVSVRIDVRAAANKNGTTDFDVSEARAWAGLPTVQSYVANDPHLSFVGTAGIEFVQRMSATARQRAGIKRDGAIVFGREHHFYWHEKPEEAVVLRAERVSDNNCYIHFEWTKNGTIFKSRTIVLDDTMI